MKPLILHPQELEVGALVESLNAGNLLAIPTETVYGLAANAADDIALKKIFRLKNRPTNHPLILHIAASQDSENGGLHWELPLSRWSRDIPPECILLAEAFWPGPLTFILKKSRHVSDLITGGQDTVGIRAPHHPFTIELLQEFGGALAAPSANRFGRISPTSAMDVFEEFEDVLEGESLTIIDGGDCQVGIESTILDLSRLEEVGPVILRPGMITAEHIHACIKAPVLTQSNSSIRHSGGMLGHYAPQTLLEVRALEDLHPEDFSLGKIAIVGFTAMAASQKQWEHFPAQWFVLDKDWRVVAQQLYRLLRDLDKMAFQKIIFEHLPEDEHWNGIRDRLTRSANGSGSL